MNKKYQKPVIGTILLSSLIFTGCTSSETPQPETTQNSEQTENNINVFNETIKIDTAPTFNIEKVVTPEGWGEDETVNYLDPSSILITKNDNSCSFSAGIYSSPAYNENKGDLYNSKFNLYNEAAPGTLTTNETIQQINSDKETISFVTGNNSRTTYDQDGNENGVSYNKTAIRVFSTPITIDYIVEEGQPTEDEYGYPLNQGLPTINMTLNCADETQLTNELWEEITNTVEIIFNTQKETTTE